MSDLAPWPYYLPKQAAKRLGVSCEIINGLARKNMIERVVSHGRSGEIVYLLRKSAVEEIAARRGA